MSLDGMDGEGTVLFEIHNADCDTSISTGD